MRFAAWLSVAGVLLLGSNDAFAAGPLIRYALIVGNNEGRAPDVQLPPLRHAEREAIELRDRLVRYGNFDPAGTVAVTGGGRKEILRAAATLAARHRAARAELPGGATLFAFFFTGHGLSGQLLTADEPLTGADLARIFSDVGATLTVGLFDACFAGALDLDSLRMKGAVATPGFNPIAELPNELLNAEGTLWFVSSRPNEQSFEDTRLGGLFSHFFIESFTAVPADALGVTLDAMWEYARSRTSTLAAKHGHTQTPVKIVRHFKTEGPVYFSFPHRRTARLRFSPELEGTYLVQYEPGGWVERVVKHPGQPLEVALFSGLVRLSKVQLDGPAPTTEFLLRDGQQVVLRPSDVVAARAAPGFGEARIQTKGELPGLDLRNQGVPDWQLTVAVGAAPVSENVLSADRHLAAGVVFASGMLSVGAELSYGTRARSFDAWRYASSEAGVRLSAGVGLEVSRFRLDAEVLGGPVWLAARYGSGEVVEVPGAWIGAGLRATTAFQLGGVSVSPFVRANLGTKWTRGMAQASSGPASAIQPTAQVGLAVRVGR